jgi:hypothetical protein
MTLMQLQLARRVLFETSFAKPDLVCSVLALGLHQSHQLLQPQGHHMPPVVKQHKNCTAYTDCWVSLAYWFIRNVNPALVGYCQHVQCIQPSLA